MADGTSRINLTHTAATIDPAATAPPSATITDHCPAEFSAFPAKKPVLGGVQISISRCKPVLRPIVVRYRTFFSAMS